MKNFSLALVFSFISSAILTFSPNVLLSQCTCTGGFSLCVPDMTPSSTYPGGVFPSWVTTVYLEGQFIIDNTFTIPSTVTITCSMNSYITVQANHELKLIGTKISLDQTCTELWRGINNYGTLTASSSTLIELAAVALTCYNGSSYSITDCFFNRNYKNIIYYAISGIYNGTCTGTRFQCVNGSNQAIPIGIGANALVKSRVGVDVTGVQLVNLGLINAAPNVFDNLDYGVYSGPSGGGANIVGGVFYRCNLLYSGVNNPAAVHMENSSGGAYTLNVINSNIGASGYTNYRGIDIDGKFNFTCTGNGITYANNYGILMTNNGTTTTNMSDCFFEHFGPSGIYFHDNPGTYTDPTTQNISNITMTNSTSSSGILDAESVIPNYVELTVENNNYGGYYFSNLNYGIRLVRLNAPVIHNNSITLIAQIGLLLNRCDDAQITDNTIAGNPGDKGISVNFSQNVLFQNNSISYWDDGLYGTNNLNLCNLICNRFDNCYYGVNLDGVVAFGDVGATNIPSDNEWTNIDPSGYGIVSSGNTPGANFDWYSIDDNPYNCYFPGQSVPPETQTVPGIISRTAVPITPICAASSCSPAIYYKLDGVAELIQQRSKLLGDIVFETGIYTTLSPFDQYMVKVFAYEVLSGDTEYLHLGTDDDQQYQDFYTALHSSSIGFFYQLGILARSGDTSAANSLNNNISAENDREYYLQQLFQIYNRTLALDTTNFTADDSSSMLDIAYMDPKATGDAPFMAQAMLGIFVLPEEGQRLSSYSNESVHEILELFPNPAINDLQYKINFYEPIIHHLEIYDLAGSLIQFEVLLSPYGNIDISNLKQGCYLVRLKDNYKIGSTLKLTKI